MRQKDKKKEALIRKEAIRMIVKDGFDGMSMRKLAKKAGLSVGTLYLYFSSREDLLLKLYHDVYTSYQEETLKGFDASLSFPEGMAILWKNRFLYLSRHADHFYFMQSFSNTPLIQSFKRKERNPMSLPLEQFLTNAMERREVERFSFELFWSVAFAPLYQLVKYQLEGSWRGKVVIDDAMLSEVLGVVLKGLRKGK